MATILVVDDDRKLIDMLRRTLAYAGYDVLTASTGHEALDKTRRQRPDLLALDWMLPEMDGIEVVRAMRAPGAPPVLMLTARDAVEDRVLGLDSGADDYLVKPFAPAELLARVRRAAAATTAADNHAITGRAHNRAANARTGSRRQCVADPRHRRRRRADRRSGGDRATRG